METQDLPREDEPVPILETAKEEVNGNAIVEQHVITQNVDEIPPTSNGKPDEMEVENNTNDEQAVQTPIVTEEKLRSSLRTKTDEPIKIHLLRMINAQRKNDTEASKAHPIWTDILQANLKIAKSATATEYKPVFRGELSITELDLPRKPSAEMSEQMHARLTLRLQKHRKKMSAKTQRLRDTYKKLHKRWRTHCDRLDNIEDARQNENDLEDSIGADLLDTAKEGGDGVSQSADSHIEKTDISLSSGDKDTMMVEKTSMEIPSSQQANANVVVDRISTTITENEEGGHRRSITMSSTHSSAKSGQMISSMQSNAPSSTILPSSGNSMTRSNRRNTQSSGGLVGFGDAVRSEAEFLEILASLESADMQDPSMRAARTTAVEPDMILDRWSSAVANGLNDNEQEGDAGELYFGTKDKGWGKSVYDDDNGFVADPKAFYESDFDPDFWSEEEMTIFARRYSLFPKQFGKIAASLPQKTTAQCVAYYYLTKKEDGHDYKALLNSRNRDRRRKTRLVKPKKGRGSALMADLKAATVEGPVSSAIEEEDASPTTPVSPNAIPATARRSASGAGRGRSAQSQRKQMTGMKGSNDSDLSNTQMSSGKSIDGSMNSSKRPRGARAKGAVSVEPNVEILAPAQQAANIDDSVLTGAVMKTSVDDPNTKQRIRQPTSSYWSVAERTQFLRSLSINGKDWDSVAQNLSTKSAAQARNYFSRNEKEADFVEAMNLANEQAGKPLEERIEAADKLMQKRALISNSEPPSLHSSIPPIVESDAHPELKEEPASRSGLNINSLLNADGDANTARSARRASAQEWFGNEQQPPSASYSHPVQPSYRSTSPYEQVRLPSREGTYIPQSYGVARMDNAYRSVEARHQSLEPSSRYPAVRSPTAFTSMPPSRYQQREYENVPSRYENVSSSRGVPELPPSRRELEQDWRGGHSQFAYEPSAIPRAQSSIRDDPRASMMPPPPSSTTSEQRLQARQPYASSRPTNLEYARPTQEFSRSGSDYPRPNSSYGYPDYDSRGQSNLRRSSEVYDSGRYGREDSLHVRSHQSPLHATSPTPPPPPSQTTHHSPLMSSQRHYIDQGPYRSSMQNRTGENPLPDPMQRPSYDRRTPPPTLPSPHSSFFGRRYDDRHR